MKIKTLFYKDYMSGPLCTRQSYHNKIEQKVEKIRRKRSSEIDVARGIPERLKLGGKSENHQLIYLSESVHRPCHVRLNSQ